MALMMYDDFKEMLEGLCHTQDFCKNCSGVRCQVGYAKHVNEIAKDLRPPHPRDSAQFRPSNLDGSFDEDEMLRIIAVTLKYCKECKDNHTEDCVLATIRNCIGMLEFREDIPYEGNTLSYLMKAVELEQTKGSALMEIYNCEKAKL